MPSEREFLGAARVVRAERDRLHAAGLVIDRAGAAPTLSGGTVAAVVQAGLEVSGHNLRRSVEHLEQLAMLFDRRAAVCAQHGAALFQWQRRYEDWDALQRQRRVDPTLPDPGPPPARPVPPAAWVEPR